MNALVARKRARARLAEIERAKSGDPRSAAASYQIPPYSFKSIYHPPRPASRSSSAVTGVRIESRNYPAIRHSRFVSSRLSSRLNRSPLRLRLRARGAFAV